MPRDWLNSDTRRADIYFWEVVQITQNGVGCVCPKSQPPGSARKRDLEYPLVRRSRDADPIGDEPIAMSAT
jgi:hypothetical protein